MLIMYMEEENNTSVQGIPLGFKEYLKMPILA